MDIRVSFPVQDNVQRQLPSVLRSGPFHHALSVAISARGLTLEQLKNRLAAHGIHLSTATLSYWKNGRRLPTRLDSLRGVLTASGYRKIEIIHTDTSHPNGPAVTRRDADTCAPPCQIDKGACHPASPAAH